MSSFGANYEDKDKALLLLASLPTHFDHLVTTLMKKDDDGSQVDGLIVKSKSSNRRRSESKSSGNRSQSRSRTKKDVECLYCHKKGHYKNLCKELKKHSEDKRNGKNPLESASVIEETSNEGEVGADLLSVSF